MTMLYRIKPIYQILIWTALILMWIKEKSCETISDKIEDSYSIEDTYELRKKTCSQKTILTIGDFSSRKLSNHFRVVPFRFDEFQLSSSVLQDADAILLNLDSRGLELALRIREVSKEVLIYGVAQVEEWEGLIEALNAGMNGTMSVSLNGKQVREILDSELFRKKSK